MTLEDSIHSQRLRVLRDAERLGNVSEACRRHGMSRTVFYRLRQRLEQHRASPACAACHRMIDPAGLALENFDATGAWRTRDGGTRGTPVDPTGQLLDGTTVNGVVALREALMRDPETFVRTMTEKLMTYALGRGLTAADMPAVRTVVRDAQKDNYRFSSIVLGIARSVPFRMRLKAPAADVDAVRTASIQ